MSSPDPTTTEWVPIWSPITVGPQGPPGPPGITSPHQATHQIGNTDVLVNNAWTNQSNTFTQDQNITSAVPQLNFNDTNQPANSRVFSVFNYNQYFTIQALDDVGTVGFGYLLLNRAGDLTVSGNIIEKNRITPMGHWTDVPFNAANFFATGGGTWTIGSAAVLRNRYTLIGKTLHWSVYISWLSGSNVIAGTVTALNITAPTGLDIGVNQYLRAGYGVDDATFVDLTVSANNLSMKIEKINGTNFTAGSSGLIAVTTFEVI